MTERIEVRGLRLVGIHGFLAHEQERAQPFEVDIDVEADLSQATETDELSDTLDYGKLAAAANTVVSGEQWKLLERMAARIAEEIGGDGRVQTVTVTVRKLRPPVPYDMASAGVRVTRDFG